MKRFFKVGLYFLFILWLVIAAIAPFYLFYEEFKSALESTRPHGGSRRGEGGDLALVVIFFTPVAYYTIRNLIIEIKKELGIHVAETKLSPFPLEEWKKLFGKGKLRFFLIAEIIGFFVVISIVILAALGII